MVGTRPSRKPSDHSLESEVHPVTSFNYGSSRSFGFTPSRRNIGESFKQKPSNEEPSTVLSTGCLPLLSSVIHRAKKTKKKLVHSVKVRVKSIYRKGEEKGEKDLIQPSSTTRSSPTGQELSLDKRVQSSKDTAMVTGKEVVLEDSGSIRYLPDFDESDFSGDIGAFVRQDTKESVTDISHIPLYLRQDTLKGI